MRPISTWIARGARTLLATCLPTADTVRGPFYRRGAPWRTRLCPIDEPGEPLSISGTIIVLPDCRPVTDAVVDVWQTNTRGLYSNLFGLARRSNARAFNLRGRLRSDDAGRYQFDSIVPGRYPLFWPLTRPRHIHVMVTHPECERLITQIYFEGDNYNRWDPWWLTSTTIRLEHDREVASGRTTSTGYFDIALRFRRFRK